MGWITSALKVAQIAGQILSQLPAPERNEFDADDEPYRPGGVEGYWDPKSGTPYLRSVADHPIGLNFVDFIGSEGNQGYSSTLIHLDKKGQGFNPRKELQFYRNGEMTVFDASPQPAGAGDDDNWRLISFGVVLILGAAATAIAGGISIGVRRTADRSELFIERRGTSLREVKLNVRAGTLKLTFAEDSAALLSDATLAFALPKDADVSLGVSVDGQLQVDEATYQALIEPTLDRVVALD